MTEAYQHTEAADVLTDEEIVGRALDAKRRAETIETESSPSRWEEADCYKALSERGWSQRKIADECGTNASTVNRFIQSVLRYRNTSDRPTFWHAYAEVTGEKSDEKTAHVSNNSGENEWYTPPEWIEAARETMGGIDLDPASCKVAQKQVKAKKFFTIDDDGLSKKWKGRVWMNPPYSRELCVKFVERLVSFYDSGDVTQTCVLVNNATDTSWLQLLISRAAAVCFPAGRISFLDKSGEPANKPLQGQVVVYLGENTSKFEKQFQSKGVVLLGHTK